MLCEEKLKKIEKNYEILATKSDKKENNEEEEKSNKE